MKGYLMQKVVNFIMNLRTTSHAFYLTRHGQSEYNDLGRIGGDSGTYLCMYCVYGCGCGLWCMRHYTHYHYLISSKLLPILPPLPLPGLTEHGVRYAEKLAGFVSQNIVKDAAGRDVPCRLWTSTMRRTKETAQFISHDRLSLPSPSDPAQILVRVCNVCAMCMLGVCFAYCMIMSLIAHV
ncbi:hypothetical protein EON63_10425 [archaeon]|nr:MAG: hypothetical protein EON63_10425 [archaeon]